MVIRIARGPEVEDADIGAFEATLGGNLPAGYRTFLSDTNGGEPEPNSIPHADGNIGVIRRFFSLGRGDLYDLARYRSAGVPLPPELLAIAEDDFGNPYAVHLETGRMYFWERELEGYEADSDRPSMAPALLIADSFDEFMSRVQPDTDEESLTL